MTPRMTPRQKVDDLARTGYHPRQLDRVARKGIQAQRAYRRAVATRNTRRVRYWARVFVHVLNHSLPAFRDRYTIVRDGHGLLLTFHGRRDT